MNGGGALGGVEGMGGGGGGGGGGLVAIDRSEMHADEICMPSLGPERSSLAPPPPLSPVDLTSSARRLVLGRRPLIAPLWSQKPRKDHLDECRGHRGVHYSGRRSLLPQDASTPLPYTVRSL